MITDIVFDFGVETSKLMNLIYSYNATNISLGDYLYGFAFQDTSVIINNLTPSLPTGPALTRPLDFQTTIAKSFESGLFFSTYPNIDSTSLNASESFGFTTITPVISPTSIQFNFDHQYQVACGLTNMNLLNAYVRNTIDYMDNSSFVHVSRNNSAYTLSHFIGFGYSSFNKSMISTKFGTYIQNVLFSQRSLFMAVDSTLQQGFKNLINACSQFSGLSYSADNMRLEKSDLSQSVIDSFLHFANINLNV